MLEAYNTIKDLYANSGYEAALTFVDGFAISLPRDELLKTNFYCYLTIQRNFKVSDSLTILQSCLAHPHCKGSIRALTRYHISQIYFLSDKRSCGNECEEIISEFIGSYHMLKERAERSSDEEEELYMLQYIIYYCLLLLGYVRGEEGKKEESEGYIKASKNLLKINNKSSQFINASSFRTKSGGQKHRYGNTTV